MSNNARVSISGIVRHIISEKPQRGGGTWIAGKMKMPDGQNVSFTVVGSCKVDDEITLFGTWEDNPKWGKQFKGSALSLALPVDENGLMRWLERNVMRVGPVAAARLIGLFGVRLPGLCKSEPERVEQEGGIPISSVQAIAAAWDANGGRLAALTWLLGAGGLTEKLAKAALDAYGDSAPRVLQDDPFKLIGAVDGFGWKTVDSLAERLGIGGNDRRRVRGAVVAVVREAKSNDGCSAVAASRAVAKAAELLRDATPEMFATAVTDAVSAGELELIDGDTLALKEMVRAESRIWDTLQTSWDDNPVGIPDEREAREYAEGFREFDHAQQLQFNSEQMDAIVNTLRYRVSVITGGAGCLHADTVIFDPVDGTSKTVAERSSIPKPFYVWAMKKDGSKTVAVACQPVRYQPERMLKLVFASGRSVTVTPAHRIWNGSDFVSAFSIFQRLERCERVHLPSNSEHDLSTQTQGVLRSMRTVASCQDGCSTDSSRCDEQPHQARGDDQSFLPSQDDAPQHSQPALLQDDLVGERTSIAALVGQQVSGHLSNLGCTGQIGLHLGGECELPRSQELREASPHSSSFERQPAREVLRFHKEQRLPVASALSTDSTTRNRLASVFAKQQTERLCISSRSHTGSFRCDSLRPSAHCDQSSVATLSISNTRVATANNDSESVEVVSAEFVGISEYYDFHVPDYENYWCEGVYHHNSGKTQLTRAIIQAFENIDATVHLMAPTGKAARRMTELTGRGAQTIHRSLGYTGKFFSFNAMEKLPRGIVVVDESSMLDSGLLSSLLDAIDAGSAIVFVGDANQLPPVGAGAFLRDVIEHGLAPVTRLTHCHRQAGALKANSVAILQGKVAGSVPADSEGQPPPWAIVSDADSPDAMYGRIRQLYSEYLPKWGLDPIRDVQFMTAQKSGPMGTKQINLLLQHLHQCKLGNEIPSPPMGSGAGDETPPMYPGDKAIQTRNHYRLNVMNGEIGIVRLLNCRLDDVFERFATPELADLSATHLVSPIMSGEGAERVCVCPVCANSQVTAPTGGWVEEQCGACGVFFIASDGRTPPGESAPRRTGRQPVPTISHVLDLPDRTVLFPMGEGGDLQLAYCLTPHKMQGSQVRCAVTMCPKSHHYMQTQNWLYTAVTRASGCSVIVGDRVGILTAAGRANSDRRETLLRLYAERKLRKATLELTAPPVPSPAREAVNPEAAATLGGEVFRLVTGDE